jgi:phosphoribosylanthranilate isomerase
MNVKLKICGLTNAEDVQAAIKAGADYLGFILYPKSPRFISPEQAMALIKNVPHEIKKVGVFVDCPPDRIIELMEFCGFDIAQLHGSESGDDALAIGREKVWKAMALNTAEDIAGAAEFPAAAILADSIGPAQRGGTGKKCDWNQAAEAAERFRLILAGGINLDNVAEAINTVKPFAVDVCSGIESSPGIKDHKKIFELAAKLKSIKR